MAMATVKEWFEQKLVKNGTIVTVGAIYIFEIFGIIKETEKAVYAMCLVGTRGDKAIKKTIWIPKSVIENLESAERFDSYEAAAQSFEIRH